MTAKKYDFIAQAKKQHNKLGQVSFSSLEWDILVSSFQKIPSPLGNFPLWKTFEKWNCENMENTLKIKVFIMSILHNYRQKKSVTRFWTWWRLVDYMTTSKKMLQSRIMQALYATSAWAYFFLCILYFGGMSTSSIKGHLPSKVIFHQMLSSIKGRLPSKVIFHQRSI